MQEKTMTQNKSPRIRTFVMSLFGSPRNFESDVSQCGIARQGKVELHFHGEVHVLQEVLVGPEVGHFQLYVALVRPHPQVSGRSPKYSSLHGRKGFSIKSVTGTKTHSIDQLA